MRFADSINVESGVGGDTCEDVFGGLKAVTKLQWRCVGTKVSTVLRHKKELRTGLEMGSHALW